MTAHLAAIVYSAGFAIDELMAKIAEELRAQGLRLGGVVQRNQGDCADDCASMTLEDLATGRLYPISEDRGAGASGCRLDAAGLAAAGGAVASALDAPVDLLIINKFGKQEALGQGLRAEIAAGILAGLPLLTAVRDDVLPAFAAFAGEDWQRLAPAREAALGWALASARQPA
jgi:nucleoside-triphosphatase THEP1